MALGKFLAVRSLPASPSAAFLLLRLVAGSALMLHGFGKIQNPFGWMGPDAATPAIFQALAAISEFGGGIAWVLGLLTPVASLGIASTMIVAAMTHMGRGDPFVGQGGSYELATVYLAISLVMISAGPGLFSADRFLFGKRGS